ncbi:MAG: DNA (cytosine-5-)-methyltransferase [Planctomycetes bacterium]|nr:DNA (cytosine-5-)-methyltransferase [Planctomycetota bacterium]
MDFSALSLFAGCGGSDLGLLDAGVEPIWANEINETACELYSQVVKKAIEHGDVRKITRFKKADILAGCYPCQGYSQGGRRNNGDGINYLYQEFDRALRQVRPLAFIVENVDGMRFSHNEPLLNNQLTRFRLAGYRVSWKVLEAVKYGLAQERRRLFIVGIRSSERKHFVFPQPSHGSDARQQRPRTLRDVIWNLRKAPAGSYCDEPFHWYYLSRNRRRTWSQQAPCIVAHWRHLGLHPDSPQLVKIGRDHWQFKHGGFARRYSYLEAAALQGFPNPHAFRAGSVRQRVRAIGNAVPPPLFGAVARALMAQLQSH